MIPFTVIVILVPAALVVLVYVYFMAREWQAAELALDDAEALIGHLEHSLHMAQDSLRAATETVDQQDHALAAAYAEVRRLRKANRLLAVEKPMTFGRLPMHHAAHLHQHTNGQQLWLTFDN